MARIKICNDPECRNAATTKGYCRLHYLRNWKKIKEDERKRLAERLNKYIEHICKTHPDNYLEKIREDLQSEKLDKDVCELMEDGVGGGDDSPFGNTACDEEIEELIKELRLEKGF